MGTRGTASFTLTSPADYDPVRPLVGQEVKFRDVRSGRVEFCGQIDKITECTLETSGVYQFECSATDLSARLDARIVTRNYGPGRIVDIVKDAVATFLNGENITTNNVTSVASLPVEMEFVGKTFNEFMTDLNSVTGDMSFVDVNGDLHCYAPGAGGTAPFSITDDSDNVESFSVVTTLIGYGNNVFVRTDSNLGVESPL